MKKKLNVLGEPLEPCSVNPLTGYYRDGCCFSGKENAAIHAVCIYATKEFLEYSKEAGNDKILKFASSLGITPEVDKNGKI